MLMHLPRLNFTPPNSLAVFGVTHIHGAFSIYPGGGTPRRDAEAETGPENLRERTR
jgi:hypothetical protein